MKKFGLLFFIILLLASGGYIYYKYIMIFSDGNRVGVLYKFSKKGNIFKTFEGEMLLPGFKSQMPGQLNSNNFYFSVTDVNVADSLERLQGQEVEVHYYQHNGALPWRGDGYSGQDGQYIVDRIVRVKNTSNVNPYGL